MCDSCTTIFDDELMRDTTRLRQKLILQEKSIIKYMDRIIAWIEAERRVSWHNHDCKSSRLRVLGVTKAKRLGFFNPSSRKSQVKRIRTGKKMSSKKASNDQILNEEVPQLASPIQDEKTNTSG